MDAELLENVRTIVKLLHEEAATLRRGLSPLVQFALICSDEELRELRDGPAGADVDMALAEISSVHSDLAAEARVSRDILTTRLARVLRGEPS